MFLPKESEEFQFLCWMSVSFPQAGYFSHLIPAASNEIVSLCTTTTPIDLNTNLFSEKERSNLVYDNSVLKTQQE